MHSSDEQLSAAIQKQRQSLPARSFGTNYQQQQQNEEETKSNVKSSDEDDEDSTVDNFDTNFDNFRPQHLSVDYDAGRLSPSYGQQQQTPGSTKKGRSLSIASVLSPLSPSNSSVNKNVPQFLTVSPTFTPRARPPPAYVGNWAGSSKPAIAPPNASPRMTSPHTFNPQLAVDGQIPSFEAAKGGTLGSATSMLLNSRSRHQSIDVKISTGSNQVLSSHLARKRQSVVSAKILETLANANANYSGIRRGLARGQTMFGSGSGPSTKYFSPSRFTNEYLKESYDEEQDEDIKPRLTDLDGNEALEQSQPFSSFSEKKISIEAPTIEQQRASILTTGTTRTFTSEEKENQLDEELLSSKMEDAPIVDEAQVKISIDASEKLSQIKESSDYDEEGKMHGEEAPTFGLGERVVWVKAGTPEYGTIKWIGRMPKLSSKWTIGVEFDNSIGNCDGNMDGKRYFQAKENYAKFLPLSSVSKLETYLTRPRSGTLLSRMSVQLKPGQLISVQRTPSINHIPIDHDVHETNMQHCLCNNCNHPCAHLCHTKNVKGSKKKQRAHMCHFSQKPHNKLCCGGEDLRQLIASGKLEKVGGLLQEVKDHQIAVAANKAERMQALKQKTSQRSSSGSRVSTTIGAHAVGSVGSAAIGAGFNTIVVSSKQQQRKSGQYSLTPEPPSPVAVSPAPFKNGINLDSSTLDRESRRRKTDRSSVSSRRLQSISAPSSVERVSVCSLSSCSKRDPKHSNNLIDSIEIKKQQETKQQDLVKDELKLNGNLQRSGSELSISSLPSTTSPVEVYIARGALTDESEYESDLENNKKINQANNINLDKASHLSSHVNSQIGSRLSSKHSQIASNNYYNQNTLSHTNIYQPHHRSAIRSMFACLVGRQHQLPANFSTSSKENYAGSNYYYDAGIDGCVRRKKTKKSKKKSSKKKRSCGQNSYCYYCTSHNNYQTSSQAPSRTSNQSTTTSLQTSGLRHSTGLNSQNAQNSVIPENTSIISGRNSMHQNQLLDVNNSNKNKSYHLNIKNSCGLSPSPEPDSQQALLSNYSDRSSCHSNNSNHCSINSSNYKDYITNYCSKTSPYNHDCHTECSRKNSEHNSRHDVNSLSSAGKILHIDHYQKSSPRSHTSSPMQISCSTPPSIKQQNISSSIAVAAQTHQQKIETDNKSKTSLSDLGDIVNTKDDPQPFEEQISSSNNTINASTITVVNQPSKNYDTSITNTISNLQTQPQPPTQMDFVEQLHQFQQNYLREHPEVKLLTSTEDQQQLVQATELHNEPNNQQQQQQNIESTQSVPFSGIILQMSTIKPETNSKTIVDKKIATAAQNKNKNIIITKTTTQQTNKDHKQKSADSSKNVSTTSINSFTSLSNQSFENKPQSIASLNSKTSETRTNKKKESKSNSRSSSRPSSKNENRNKSENQSTQSIQTGRPDSTKSNRTELSSNEIMSKGEDSTTNSILSLNSSSIGAGQSNSIVTSNSESQTTDSINQSQTSIASSTTSKTLPRRTKPENKEPQSITTSTTSINSQTASSSNTSGIVITSQSPIRRRKKPPAPKPPINKDQQLSQQTRASSNTSQQPPINLSKDKVPTTYCNLAFSHSNCSLQTTTANTCSSLSMNLTTTTSSNSSTADINSLTRRKKFRKNKPAPPVPIFRHKQEQQINQKDKKIENIKLSNNEINSSSSCSKQSTNNKRLNGNRLTPHKTPCLSVNHRNKSNVKQRINRILARSLSEAYRLNAKTALSSVQHSFSSEVNLNKRNLNTMINTAFTDSFNGQQSENQHIKPINTPDTKIKKLDESKDLNNKNSDTVANMIKNNERKQENENNKLESNKDQNDSILSPFSCGIMDRTFINSNRLVNQLFTTQPNQINYPIRRSSSLPYLDFLTTGTKCDKRKEKNNLKSLKNQSKANRKGGFAHNVASDLIIEQLSNNLYNGSADQLLYAAELLEEFSENIIAVPSLSSQLASLLSPQHYKMHNLNNQLLLINHYMDCLKHEQEQEELLTVQLIEQQQVNRMRIEINKEQELNQLNKDACDNLEIEKEINLNNSKDKIDNKLTDNKIVNDKNIDQNTQTNPNSTTATASKMPTPKTLTQNQQSKKQNQLNTVKSTRLTLNGHESTQSGSDELHSDTSDQSKVTVKCMPTNRFQELQFTTASSLSSGNNHHLNDNIVLKSTNKQVTASSSGLSSSSSKTLLVDSQDRESKTLKRSLDNLEHSNNLKSSNYSSSLNKNLKYRHHHCSNSKNSNSNNYCLMHSQSSHCLNEQHRLNEHFHHLDESSSSSSSQSTRSTEDLNWSSTLTTNNKRHQFAPSFINSINKQQFNLNSHLNHSLHHRSAYLNQAGVVSSSECSTDESCSVDSPMMHLHRNCIHHSNSFNAINDMCACCEHQTHSHRFKSGIIPNSNYLNESSITAGAYSFEPGKHYNQEISNLYDYHSSHLEDMFSSESSALINQELTDLMEQLQIAISSGEHKKAALLAREAALRKVTCTLQRSTPSNTQPIVVYLYIEDLNNHVQGPIPLQVLPTMTVRALKIKVQKEFGFDVSIQKWILGKSLASNEDASLLTYGITTSGCPIFLYLFNSEELYDYHHDHQFLTDSLPSLVEMNEEQFINDEEEFNEHHEILAKKLDKELNKNNKKLDKKLSTSLDTSLSQKNLDKVNLNKRLDKSLDVNLNKNKTIDRRSNRKQKITTLIDEMLDCKFDDEISYLSPPMSFQSESNITKTLIEPLIDNNDINWINNKLHDNQTNRKTNNKIKQSNSEEYESASENLIGEDHSFEEDRSIEEILIEEEVYELDDHLIKPSTSTKKVVENKINQNYNDLIKLDDLDLVTNKEAFECSICLNDIDAENGVILKECLHSFCKDCLINCVEHNEQPPVMCPFDNDQYKCKSEISEREIRALLNDENNLNKYEQYLKKSIKLASLRSTTDNAIFLCKTPNCDGFCYYETNKENTKWFICPLCLVRFCLKCKESHNEEQQCKLDDEQLKQKELTEDEKKSEKFIQEMIEKNQAINCPKCNIVVIKKWGCQLVKCSMCKTQICYITRKPRWGPGGFGDTSDGCKCMVMGKKCHPLCDYCH